MKKKKVELGVLSVNLPPALHAKLKRIAEQAGTTVEVVMAVMLVLQFPLPPNETEVKL